MQKETQIKFAEELKNTRESKKISLQQIAQKTKIDIKFLQAIEEARFDVLPDIYMRAFIKEYAQNLELNPDEIVKRYISIKTGSEETAPKEEKPLQESSVESERIKKEFVSPTTEAAPPPGASSSESFKFTFNYLAGGVIIVIAAALFYFAFFYESSPEIIQEATENLATNEEPRYEIEQKKDTVASPVVEQLASGDSLMLVVNTSEDVWVKVLADGRNIHQKMVPRNSKLIFKSKEKFSVSVGNAGAVKLLFNNKEVPDVGKYGEIRNIVITKDLTRYYTVPRNEKKPQTTN